VVFASRLKLVFETGIKIKEGQFKVVIRRESLAVATVRSHMKSGALCNKTHSPLLQNALRQHDTIALLLCFIGLS